MAAQEGLPRSASLAAFLAFLGYVLGAFLLVLGAVSWGFQLVLMPTGFGILVGVATRRDPRLALSLLAGGVGLSIASVLSYTTGLAETIFTPHLGVVVGLVAPMALIGYLAGRWLERGARTRRGPASPS